MEACITIPQIADIIADTNIDVAWPFKGDWRITGAWFATTTVLAAHATNFYSVGLSTAAATGASFTSAGSFDTDSGGDAISLAVGASQEITVSGAATQISEGYVLRLVLDESGTVAAMGGTLTVVAEKIP